MSYDGSKSQTSAENIIDFLDKYSPNTELQNIPGIGPVSVEKLKNENVHTVAQLISKFLSGVGPESNSESINQQFYDWLKETLPATNIHTIVFAVAHLADKFDIVKYE